MIDHHQVILNKLHSDNNYKSIEIKQIIGKEVFNSRQFEFICLGFYENFMKAFYSDDYFQVRLLDLSSINGLAFKTEKTYYSLIHWGTISTIYENALILTENNDFFPDVFTNEKWCRISENDISLEDIKAETPYRKIYPCGTNDKARRDLAFLIANFAWLSTVFHESGHIIHGHLEYLKQKFQEDSLALLYNNITNEEIAISRKVLEKDADEFSGNRIVEHAFSSDSYLTYYSNVIKDNHNLLKIVVAGITLKFLLYGIKLNLKNRLYLPNAYRIITILDAGLAMLENSDYFQIDANEYHDIVSKSILTTLKAFNNKFSKQAIDINTFSEQLSMGLEEDRILKNKWNEIMPILNNYKHPKVKLPPFF